MSVRVKTTPHRAGGRGFKEPTGRWFCYLLLQMNESTTKENFLPSSRLATAARRAPFSASRLFQASRNSFFSDEPCHVNDYASYGDVDFKDGHIRYDFRYNVKCETVARFRGCCDSSYDSGGKNCINDGGIWIADGDGVNAAEFSCCDPRLFEGLLNSKYCVVDGSKGDCYSADDGCIPIRYTDQGGCFGAESGVTSGIAGCDDDKVLEIFNEAPQCV